MAASPSTTQVEIIGICFDGGGVESPVLSPVQNPKKSSSKKEKILKHLKCSRKLFLHVDLNLASCGKWRVSRSLKQCQELQRALDKEFPNLAPKQPPYPASYDLAPAATVPFQQYFNELLKYQLISSSRHVHAFLSIPDETLQIGDGGRVLKEGAMKYKGKKEYWCIMKDRYLAIQERKNAERYMLVLMLDGCNVEKGPATSFTVSVKGGKKSKKYMFSTPTESERENWIEAIATSNKIYDSSKFRVHGSLNVTVVEGRSLAAKDFSLLGGRSDPFVILRLEHQQFHTHIIPKTLNPVWNAEFDFQISQNSGILYMLVYDYDLLKKSDSMGQVLLPLSSMVPDKEVDMWLPVLPKKKNEKVKGEVRIKVRYEFTKEMEAGQSVFGKPLEEVVSREDICVGGVPKFFAAAIEFLEKNAMEEEGIFRLSGSLPEIKKLKSDVDQGLAVDFKDADPHAVTGLIKLYLRELPNPLLTFDKYDAFLAAGSSDAKSQVSDVANIVKTLPPAHFPILKLLLPFLNKLSQNSQVTMMSSKNLAIVFGPPLLHPKEETFETMYHTEAVNELAAVLIVHCDEIISSINV